MTAKEQGLPAMEPGVLRLLPRGWMLIEHKMLLLRQRVTRSYASHAHTGEVT